MKKYQVIEYLYNDEECKELLPKYPGYFITTRGRVWNNKRGKWVKITEQQTYMDKRRKKPPSQKRYYHYVYINNKKVRVHTLVGRYFLPEYKPGMFILHKNEELSYPNIHYVENLWVGTNSDNMKDMWKKGRRECNFSKK